MDHLMPDISFHVRLLLGIVLAVWLSSASACATAPTATPAAATLTPVPIASPSAAAPASVPATAASGASSDQIAKAVIADWEEMFRTRNCYEYIKTNGQINDKAWWIEQARRFYTGTALNQELQNIEFMFSPRSLGRAFAFIENAQYTVQLQSCASSTECTLQISLQDGKFWAYDVHYKTWAEANPVTPSEWTVNMQFDPAAGHWKIK
jgi:hypothetical protein